MTQVRVWIYIYIYTHISETIAVVARILQAQEWNLTLGPPRTTPEPIWAETPKLSAGGEQNQNPQAAKMVGGQEFVQAQKTNKPLKLPPKKLGSGPQTNWGHGVISPFFVRIWPRPAPVSPDPQTPPPGGGLVSAGGSLAPGMEGSERRRRGRGRRRGGFFLGLPWGTRPPEKTETRSPS